MKQRRPFTGTITAIVTPFKSGAVAYDDLKKLAGQNVLRALRAAERTAERLRKDRQPSTMTLPQVASP